jgi:lipopolysaccharide export system permease protein
MKRVANYINNHLFSSFISFFIPLFGIASLIFFIKIVSVTSIIKLSFLELLQMYIFILPQILFFTLSIVFFISSISTIYKLSFEYELIAIFSLGISPNKITKILMKNAFFLSIILLMLSLILVPQAKQLYKGFIIYKKASVKLNLKPNEFGHKFGDWYLFIEDKKDNRYINIALYNKNLKSQENFITAKEATISSDSKGIKLTLKNGKAYLYKEQLKEIFFKKMDIYHNSSSENFLYKSVIEYWLEAFKNHRREFDITLYLFISLFPIASIFFIPYIAISNIRYEKRNIFIISLLILAIYFAFAFGLAKPLGVKALIFLPIWFFTGLILYKKRVLKRY